MHFEGKGEGERDIEEVYLYIQTHGFSEKREKGTIRGGGGRRIEFATSSICDPPVCSPAFNRLTNHVPYMGTIPHKHTHIYALIYRYMFIFLYTNTLY